MPETTPTPPEKLDALLQKAKTAPVPYAFAFKGRENRLALHATREGKRLLQGLRADLPGAQGVHGTLRLESGTLVVDVDRKQRGLKSRFRAYFKDLGTPVKKFEFRLEGSLFHDEDEAYGQQDNAATFVKTERRLLQEDLEELSRRFTDWVADHPGRKAEALAWLKQEGVSIPDEGLNEAALVLERVRARQEELERLSRTGDQVREDLRGKTDPAAARARARQWVDTFDRHQIVNLPANAKAALLRALGTEPRTPEEHQALLKLHSAAWVDERFEQLEVPRRDALLNDLGSDPVVKQANESWTRLDADARLKVLARMLDHICARYGITPVPIVYFEQAPQEFPGGLKGYTQGFYSNGKISINRHPETSIDDFPALASIFVHEALHRYQERVVKDFEAGRIGPEHPEYDQAQLFAANSPCYLSDMPAYLNQPMEIHCRLVGGALEELLRRG